MSKDTGHENLKACDMCDKGRSGPGTGTGDWRPEGSGFEAAPDVLSESYSLCDSLCEHGLRCAFAPRLNACTYQDDVYAKIDIIHDNC